ncbi:class I adenylate-forming enzyme family protein [Blautia sp.]|uniref:class I adenylate-forming enzyme family protein n=1 Tax=Blautia sp. TaxID=1955243 RepID=UPI003AB6D258
MHKMYKGIELWKKDITRDMVEVEISDDFFIKTYPKLPKNIFESFKNTTYRMPEKTAVVDNWGRDFSYGELLHKTDLFSAWAYEKLGIRRGTHVALMLYNSVEFCVTFLSLNRIGAVVIPLPTKYRKDEVRSLLEKSDVDFIITDERFNDYFDFCKEENISVTVFPDGEKAYALDEFSCHMTEELKRAEEEVTNKDLALLVFTSGTTSQSKGVVIKNYNIMHAIVSYERTLKITKKDRAIIPIPIYLITGLVAIFGLMMHVGGTVYLNKFFDGKRVLEDVKKYEITFLHASPTVFTLLLKEANAYPRLPSLRMFACGSSNMPPGKIRMLHNWLPNCEFRTIYGLTETTSPATVFPLDANESPYIGSSGIPIPGLSFKILDNEGKEVPPGTEGTVWVKGSNITECYYKMETEAIQDHWLDTGDIGYFNESGYIYIVDRRKDMINRGGEKICSFDVENEILNITGVEDAAVVGIPDELYGEVPVAVVKLGKDSLLTEEEIRKILKNKIAGFKIPQKIIKVDSIPVTENMKTDKKYIRQLFS